MALIQWKCPRCKTLRQLCQAMNGKKVRCPLCLAFSVGKPFDGKHSSDQNTKRSTSKKTSEELEGTHSDFESHRHFEINRAVELGKSVFESTVPNSDVNIGSEMEDNQ